MPPCFNYPEIQGSVDAATQIAQIEPEAAGLLVGASLALGGERHDARGTRGRPCVGVPANHAHNVVQSPAGRWALPA